jgi:5-methylcytosine-specific restriction enzyme subunit McrC
MRGKGFKSDPKKGVLQADLYQMVSYAFRRGCSNVLVLYPNVGEQLCEFDVFEVLSGFPDQATIRIFVAEIPFWSMSSFDNIESALQSRLEILLDKMQLHSLARMDE